ncbi:Uncharacterised protein [Vibrio cholerae]|nr:Uncharacterised protein [Vibrio cholerae]CSI54372.1 Uncharacterised protein [Vibrio cholerae]
MVTRVERFPQLICGLQRGFYCQFLAVEFCIKNFNRLLQQASYWLEDGAIRFVLFAG